MTKNKHYTGTIEWSGTFDTCPLIELKNDGTLGKVTHVLLDFKLTEGSCKVTINKETPQ